jgi:lantibiotic modifying enzyme
VEERFRQAALEAIAYERSLFDTEHRNWPRVLHQRGKDFPVSWCHGAPGIGLCRLAALDYINDEQIGQEIEIALETTIKQGFGHNQSICHGDLGNLETVLMAAQVLKESGYHEHLKRLTALVFCGISGVWLGNRGAFRG